MKLYQKILLGLALLAVPLIVVAAPVTPSAGVGTNPVAGSILQTNGATSTWVTTSSLGISGGGSGSSTLNGTGTPYYVPYWISTSTLSSSSPIFISSSTGNVGIGTTSPSQALGVAGNVYATGYVSGGTTNTYGAITASGGTGFSSVPLDIASLGIINSTAGWFGNGFLFSNHTAGTGAFSMVYDTDVAYFGNALANSVWGQWTSTGLRLGTYVAGGALNKLDVGGAAAIGSYAGVNTAPSNGLIVSGNVGIGTTAPSSMLHVVSNTTTTAIFAHSGTATTTVIQGTASSTACSTFYTPSGTPIYSTYLATGQILTNTVSCQ